MAPPNPSLFGRFGTAAALEKEVRQADRFASAIEGATDALNEMHGAGAKTLGEQKKRHAEVAAAIKHVSKALKGTTQNADKYGKAVQRDTKIVLDFAKKHKLSLKEAAEMYDRVREKQGLLNKGFEKGVGILKRWGTAAATVGAALTEYRKRLDEIHTGHQLFLSDVALTGPGAEGAFKQTQKYVDGYREAVRGAREMTKKWGVSAEEAKGTVQALAFSLRGQIKDVSKLGQVLTEDTDRIYGFAKAMNVDAGTALTFFRNQMRVQGKTHEQARQSLDTVISGFDSLRVKVGGAAAPLKEEYLATLQQIRQEMGPVQVSTAAVTAAMNMMAEGAKKAGLSAKGVTDSMAAIPTLLKGLPTFYKMKIGGGLLHSWKTSESFRKSLEKTNPAVARQMATLSKMRLPMFQKAQIAQNIAGGTKAGLKAMFASFKGMTGAMRYSILKSAGLTDQQYMALDAALKKGPQAFSAVADKIQKGTKKATDVRQTLADNLSKNTTGLDGLAKKVFELEQTVRKLMDQYSTLVTPALGALTLAMNAGTLVSGIKGLAGGIGGLAGKLGGAGGGLVGRVAMATGKFGLVGAGLAGLYFGLEKAAGALDKLHSKAIKGAAARKGVESALGAVRKEKDYEARVTQMKTLIGKDNFLTLEGKINKAFLAKKAMQVAPGTGAAERRGREFLIAKWTKKLEEITGKRGDMFGKGAELKEAARRRKLDIDVAKENEKRRREGRAELRRKRGDKTIDQMFARERREQARAQRGQANLKLVTPTARARVPAAAAQASVAQADPLAERPATPAARAQPITRFDPATGTYTAQMTISANDPNWQSFFQQNQAIFNQGKRSR